MTLIFLATQSGSWSVTANQGTANTLANAWSEKITDGTNGPVAVKAASTGAGAADPSLVVAFSPNSPLPTGTNSIGTVNQGTAATLANAWSTKITDATNGPVAVKASGIAPLSTDPSLVVSLSPNNSLFSFGGDSRLRIGQETMLFFDNIEGTSVDTNKWTQSQSGMTQTQSGARLTLNAGASLTSGNYSILTSNKQMLILVEYPQYVQFRAQLTTQTNSVLEMGFGNVATTSAPTDGVLIRVTSAGTVLGVVNFNGTETTTTLAAAGVLSNSTFYNFEITIFEDQAEFEITSSDHTTTVISVTLPYPNGNGSATAQGHLPVYARVYNSGTTTTAAKIILASVNVQQMDLNMVKSWAEQASGAGRSSIVDPVSLAQSANYTNNTAPVSATLSNTAAGYTTLGGLFQFAAVASAETDYALFAYQVPVEYQLYIWTITITAFITGAQSTTQPTLLQWAFAANSSAVSLATGAPNPPMRTPIGMQQAAKSANIGDTFEPGTITYAPKTPIVVNSNKFLHVILRIPISNATTNQIIRGSVTMEGYFE